MTDAPAGLAAALSRCYRIERELGRGGMATVYLAEDLKHHRKVAVKVLKPELAAVLGADRFVQEITTTAALQHPHILPLFDSGTADGFLFYVMPFIDGETLRARLDRETQLGVEEAVRITTSVADALDYAHRHGVIHRDIKPENILLHDGSAMVADFGIALAVSAAAGGRMTETGLSLGTPHYMSPEQATAEKEITARSDIYSLGSVLYEMLIGNPPHTGASAQQIIMKIVTEDAAPVTRLRKSVPPNVAAAVGRALEKLPADRFDSARAFADALGNPAFEAANAPRRAGGATGRVRMVSRQSFAGMTALAAVLLVLALWGWLRRGPVHAALDPRRVDLSLPRQYWFSRTGLAMSPDGSILAAVADSGAGGQLVVHRASSSEFEVIPGTAGADNPFFSPDGKWIGFLADGKLRRVPVAGGPPVIIADSVDWGEGAWADDGMIYYTPHFNGGVWRVAASGGKPEPVTVPDSTAGELGHWNPSPVARGKAVLFTAYVTPFGHARVEVVIPATHQIKVVLEGAYYPRYLSPGRLLFIRNGTLMVAEFDPDRLEVTGAPVPASETVALAESNAEAGYAIAGDGTLAYLPRAEWGAREVVALDRAGRVGRIIDSVGRFGAISLDPGGRRLAIEFDFDLYSFDLSRGFLTRLTRSPELEIAPVWSRDGHTLYYGGEGRRNFDVFRRSADGGGAETLVYSSGHDMYPSSVSPDGTALLFTEWAPVGDLRVLSLDGHSPPRSMTRTLSTEEHGTYSPNGRWIAYQSDESGDDQVYLQRAGEGSWPDRIQVSRNGGANPRWDHDGRELLFLSAGGVTGVAIDPGSGRVGTSRVLYPGRDLWSAVQGSSLEVGPDGRLFAIRRSRELAPRRIHLVLNWGAAMAAGAH
jgi:serine/threonine-protein kinase